MWHASGQERCMQGFDGESRGKDLDADGRIIFRWIFRKWDGGHGLD
jgi:hypothetical protein